MVPVLPSFSDLANRGIAAMPAFVSEEECENLLRQIEEYRAENELPEVFRQSGDRPLHYKVIDGDRIRDHLPDLVVIYERVHALVNDAMRVNLEPLADQKVGLNVNVTAAGGTYRWHYDRNAVTVILYLNAVPGGETEIYPNYRLFMEGARYSGLQQLSDRLLELRPIRSLFGKLVRVKPKAGLLIAMRGNRCLHSVRPVEGDEDRINVIMSFDTPSKQYDVASQLNSYLYESDAGASDDPNYR